MSFASLIDQRAVASGFAPMRQDVLPTTDLWDVTAAAYEDIKLNSQINSEAIAYSEVRSERADKYRELTGKSLPNFIKIEIDPNDPSLSTTTIDEDRISEFIKGLRETDSRFNSVFVGDEVEAAAIEKAQMARGELESVSARAGGARAIAGGLIAGLAAAPTDPIALATLPFGLARTAGRSTLRIALREAAVAAGGEVVASPAIMEWQNTVGNEYGLSDILTNVVAQAVFAGGISAATVGIPRALASRKQAQLEALATAPLSPDGQAAASLLARENHINTANPSKAEFSAKEHYDTFNKAVDALVNDGDFEAPNIPLRDDLADELPIFDRLPPEIQNLTPELHKTLNEPIATKTPSLRAAIKESGGFKVPANLEAEIKGAKLGRGLVGTKDKPNTPQGSIKAAIDVAMERGYFAKRPTQKEFLQVIKNDTPENPTLPQYAAEQNAPLLSQDTQALNVKNNNINALKQAGIDYTQPFEKVKKAIDDVRPRTEIAAGKIPSPVAPLDIPPVRPDVTPERASLDTIADYEANFDVEFDDLYSDFPDLEIQLDDRVVTMAQLKAEFEQEEQIWKALSVCSV